MSKINMSRLRILSGCVIKALVLNLAVEAQLWERTCISIFSVANPHPAQAEWDRQDECPGTACVCVRPLCVCLHYLCKWQFTEQYVLDNVLCM